MDMNIAMRLTFWVVLFLDVLYNIFVFIYVWYHMRSSDQADPTQLETLAKIVVELEMTGIKYGKAEVVKVVIAHLIEKGAIMIKEIVEREERTDSRSSWDGDRFEPGTTTTSCRYCYLYKASPHRPPVEMTPLEEEVLRVLSRYMSAEEAAEALGDHEIFRAYRQKMRDFALVREKTSLEEGIELFYSINYFILAAALIWMFVSPPGMLQWTILVLSGINTLAGIITRLVYYGGRLSFNKIYPGMIPRTAYPQFLRLYEDIRGPVSGAGPYRRLLQGD